LPSLLRSYLRIFSGWTNCTPEDEQLKVHIEIRIIPISGNNRVLA
jgi:hypothetical protein